MTFDAIVIWQSAWQLVICAEQLDPKLAAVFPKFVTAMINQLLGMVAWSYCKMSKYFILFHFCAIQPALKVHKLSVQVHVW